MTLVIDMFSWICLLSGGFFVLASTIGLLRFPDFFTRLHAAGLADTLGVLLITIGLIFQAGFSHVSVKLILIFVFIFFTSPAATHALAKAAIHGGLKQREKV